MVELYYDPFDHAIDDDPYPVWKRMRAEAPLYFNEKYNFYALSRYEDVARLRMSRLSDFCMTVVKSLLEQLWAEIEHWRRHVHAAF